MHRTVAVAAVSVLAASLTLTVSAAGRPGGTDASTSPGVTSPTPAPSPTPDPSPTPSPSRSTTPSAPVADPFAGTSAVGALFTVAKRGMRHFCTAAVVHSPKGDLVITAAHCLQGRRLGPGGNVIFVPGYHDGKFPKGRWAVMSEIVDSKWRKHKDANDDVAFLIVGRPGHKIEKYTGAETLETRTRMPQTVRVIGYPDSTSAPVKCTAPARLMHKAGLRQLVFDCGGFTDGTSGGPFLMRVNAATGAGDVIGVIGGFQEGGDSPSVSYSARFLLNVLDLYKRAIR